ncbi:retropepsin-like aspartic protease [Sphaerotilus sp.]|uniref:retropepsin-like aspartic protease family protein n=1 Tax=Sphaerotilus sp. TaxID=2093942 RepID=UPI002ACDA1A9|nr:retropepsin-like aspartic protease [Sphaerotilus sp.]MDZ7858147.1 retropepsin-like aspartic protease [Sphaerotilus sp.]
MSDRRPCRGWLPGLAPVSLLLLALSCSAPGRVLAANASTVVLAGTMGDKVVLVIDGRTRVMTVGETVDGLRVQRGSGAQSVVLDSGGGRQELVVGAAPVAVGPAAGGRGVARKLVLQAGRDQLFHADGEINGQAVQGVVDTGASVVVLSTQAARRLGVDWQAGTTAQVQVQTASGRSVGRRVRLAQVSLGPLQARDVEAVVIDSDMPFVLYGNSFLRGFRLQWEQGRLSLTP